MSSRKPFREVWHLLVAPDFSRVERGEIDPPWVDQRSLDFSALRQLYQDSFANGDMQFRVPNDTIDQVTVHFREMSGAPDVEEQMRCRDFAKAFLKAARRDKGEVVDVARAWRGKHHLEERRVVPPPVILPMVVEARDFEDMMFARMAATTRLGMSSGNPLEALAADPSLLEGRDPMEALREAGGQGLGQGHLPEAFRSRLEGILGAEYIAEALLDCGVAHDPLPSWLPEL